MKNKVLYTGILCIAVGTLPMQNAAYAQVTPQQIAMMKTVTNSGISHDGQFIAYTISMPVDPKVDNLMSNTYLYILNTKTGTVKELYTESSVSQIQFKPNSHQVSFITKQKDEKTNALYEINAASGELKKAYQFTSSIVAYSWHPNGQILGFVSSESAQKPTTPLNYAPKFFEEDYNNRFAYIVNTQSNDAPKKINVSGAVYLINWSPNGQHIALSSAPTASVDDSYMAQSISIIDASTLNVTATINNKGKLSQIEWSPNNDKLALVAAYDLNDPTDGTLHIASVNGGNTIVIDGNYLGKYESIIWTDPKEIHFRSSEGLGSAIGKITVDGKNKTYIFKSNTHAITSFSKANNGEISFTSSTPEFPSELFTVHERNRKAPIKRTNNNEWLSQVKLGEQKIITYTARDKKYEIEGILVYPLNYKPGVKYPLITVVHGGPEAHYSNGWLTAYSMPGQMGAAEDYMVFYPNYRGSTGRGIDFTYSSQRDLSGKEFDDIVDGVDHLIGLGLVDEKRVGVTGGSYGGYASAWMSTYYSDRFAAAVMFVGISNNISKFGTSDIPNEMYLVHSRKRVWEDWEWQLKISPIYYVDRAQTPILIMHGADDPRVHPAQSMELYRHIKVRKPEVPVRLIYYPGEGHGNARSGSKYDYNFRMMQWFDTYLKSGNRQAPLPSLDFDEKY